MRAATLICALVLSAPVMAQGAPAESQELPDQSADVLGEVATDLTGDPSGSKDQAMKAALFHYGLGGGFVAASVLGFSAAVISGAYAVWADAQKPVVFDVESRPLYLAASGLAIVSGIELGLGFWQLSVGAETLDQM